MRMFVVLWMLAFASVAVGQVRTSRPHGCDQLFSRPVGSGPSDAEVASITERWLVVWYPTRARLDEARAKQIAEKT